MTAVLKTVQKAQKDQGNCASCKDPLPRGGPYRYYRPGFRSKVKVTVCLKATCTPRRSQLDQSRMSDAYAAIEAAEDAIGLATSVEEIRDALDECVGAVRDVSEEYQATISETPMLEGTLQERVDELEQFADDLDSLDIDDEPDGPEKPSDDLSDYEDITELNKARKEYNTEHDEWENDRDQAIDDAKEAANDALTGL